MPPLYTTESITIMRHHRKQRTQGIQRHSRTVGRTGGHTVNIEMATAGLLLYVGFVTSAGVPEIFPVGNPLPVVGPQSGDSEVQLAQHLSRIGVLYYGAWWCPHCHQQNALFGREAVENLSYVECDRDGRNPQTQTCREADVAGYPTWEINGELYAGVQSLETLADLSGYTGPRAFVNKAPFR